MMIMISTQRLTGGDLGMDSGQYGARAVPQHCLVIHLNFYTMTFTFHIGKDILDNGTVRGSVHSVQCLVHSGGPSQVTPCALCSLQCALQSQCSVKTVCTMQCPCSPLKVGRLYCTVFTAQGADYIGHSAHCTLPFAVCKVV